MTMPNYPKFSGVRTRCPKCATLTDHPVQYFLDTSAEYMARNCKTCAYKWRELITDAPASSGGDGDSGNKKRTAAPDLLSLLGLVDIDKLVDGFINNLREKK
jgi:hypothetical protein